MGLRYKKVNEFLLPLGSVPHPTAWRTLWRDGLDRRSFAKQACSLICCRRTAQLVAHMVYVGGLFVGILGLNLHFESH